MEGEYAFEDCRWVYNPKANKRKNRSMAVAHLKDKIVKKAMQIQLPLCQPHNTPRRSKKLD